MSWQLVFYWEQRWLLLASQSKLALGRDLQLAALVKPLLTLDLLEAEPELVVVDLFI